MQVHTEISRPLCVDLDGTLISSDTLLLSVMAILRSRPWLLLRLFFPLLKGRPKFKSAVASLYQIDTYSLPWRATVMEFLYDQKTCGRKLVLATAAHRKVAEAIAAHLGIFDAVISTDYTHNLKGNKKLAAILEFTDGGKFDYMGDSWSDLPIFKAAQNSIVVTRDNRLLANIQMYCRIEKVFCE